jgi:hypothetical protein
MILTQEQYSLYLYDFLKRILQILLLFGFCIKEQNSSTSRAESKDKNILDKKGKRRIYMIK